MKSKNDQQIAMIIIVIAFLLIIVGAITSIDSMLNETDKKLNSLQSEMNKPAKIEKNKPNSDNARIQKALETMRESVEARSESSLCFNCYGDLRVTYDPVILHATMTNSFMALSYRERLQETKWMSNGWRALCTLEGGITPSGEYVTKENWRVVVKDYAGLEVGGYSDWKGVWAVSE